MGIGIHRILIRDGCGMCSHPPFFGTLFRPVSGDTMKKIVASVAVAATLATSTACDSFGQAMSAHKDVLARAAGHELSIDKAASLFALNPRIPPQPDVVNAIANLWIDYTLLATAATKDSSLTGLNLDPIIEPYIEQETVWRLR